MAWWLYNVAMILGAVLLAPLLIALAVASGKRRPSVLQRLGVKRPAGYRAPARRAATIWVHALSVGEVTAARPLVQRLGERYGRQRIVLTASTLTGFETAARLFGADGFQVAYFPYDLIFSVKSVVRCIDPAMVILIETDIWPNFLNELNRRNIPVFLANYRLSDSTWRKYRAFRGWTVRIFESFERIFVQTRRDARRLETLGIGPRRLHTTGSLKFDLAHPPPAGDLAETWRRRLRLHGQRPVVVAGSTHPGDEAVLLEALAALHASGGPARAVLIIAPRDPARSPSVAALCRAKGASCRRLSEMQPHLSLPCPDVVVVDSIGVLNELYCLASVAFIGGSLSDEGGHNPLEPAVFGKPVLFGPDMRDFRQVVDWLLEAGGALQVKAGEELGAAFEALLNDPQTAAFMGRRALSVCRDHRGAADRIVQNLEPISETITASR